MTDQSVSMGEDDPEAVIMDATYRAVCAHGFADVTMQDIADECELSKSSLHYHYDTKEDLLVAFLEQLVDEFEADLERLRSSDAPPADRLREYLHWFAVGTDETDRASLHLALLELRSQAPHNPRFRDPFRRSTTVGQRAFAEIIIDGQRQGEFDPDVDPDALAQLCYVAMDGARARQVTLGIEGYAAEVAETLHALLRDRLTPEAQ